MKDSAVPRSLLPRAGRPGVLLPVEVGSGYSSQDRTNVAPSI